jgi:hypothetical protein
MPTTGKSVSLRSARAAKARAELVQALGGRCRSCGEIEDLQFDCISPRGPAHKLMPWPARIRWYWQEHLRGNIQLLCPRCHVRKTCFENQKGPRFLSPLPSALHSINQVS